MVYYNQVCTVVAGFGSNHSCWYVSDISDSKRERSSRPAANSTHQPSCKQIWLLPSSDHHIVISLVLFVCVYACMSTVAYLDERSCLLFVCHLCLCVLMYCTQWYDDIVVCISLQPSDTNSPFPMLQTEVNVAHVTSLNCSRLNIVSIVICV